MSPPQRLPVVWPAPEDSPWLCAPWGLGPREGRGENPHGRGFSWGFPNIGETCLGSAATPSVTCLLESCSAVRGKGHEIWLLPTGSPSPHSVCVSSDKAVLPGDPDYI